MLSTPRPQPTGTRPHGTGGNRVVLVKSVEVDIGVKGDRESKAKLDDISKRAEELRKAFPEYKLKINSAAASERLKVFRAQLAEATKDRTATVKVKVDNSELKKALGGLNLNPGLLGPAVALAPAAGVLGGVAAGAAAGLAGAFTAAAGALAAFGAVAKPVFADAKKAAGAVEKAQNAYNIAIANGVPPAKAFKAEQLAIAKAYAGMSPAQIALSKQLGAMANSWDAVKAAQTPVVAGALQPWLKSVTDLTGKLGPIIAKVAPVIGKLGGQFDALIKSPAFTKFRDFIANTGSKAAGAIGSALIGFINAFITLLPKFNPLIQKAIGWIAGLGPAVATWASSKKASDDITKFMQWFSQNGSAVGGLLKNIGGALKAMAPGLTAGGTSEIQVMSQFFALVAKLPPGLAKPLFSVAGAMLILNKMGVVTVGIKLVGLGAAATGAGTAAGPFAAAGAAIAAGILLEIRRDISKGWKTAISDLPKLLEGVGGILNFSASGWANTILDHFSKPVRKMWDDLGHFLVNSFDITRHQVSHLWDVLMNVLAKSFDIFKNLVGIKWDDIKLTFLRGVQYILNIMGKLPGPLGAPFRAAAKDIGGSMAAIQADVRRRIGQIQKDFDSIHGKTVTLQMIASGQGGVKVASPGQAAKLIMLSRLAGGGLIRAGTGPAADDVPAMLSRGEVVVPAGMVRAGAVDHLRGRLPGFAAGGLATLGRQAAAMPGAVSGAVAAGTGAALTAETRAAVQAMAAAIAAAFNPFAGISGVPSGGPIGAGAAAAQAFAKSILWAYGWGQNQFPPLQALWNGESGWRWNALNRSSGAYGIPQSLPASKMASAGADWRTNAATQIRWGLGYIKSNPNYGSPARAYSLWLSRSPHWYDRGGWLMPGLSLAYNGTGRPEQVIPPGRGGGTTYVINVQSSPLARPADTGRAVVTAIKEFEKRSGKGWRS
jgi:hypothetical protein